MGTITMPRDVRSVAALDATTMCEAFQLSAAERRDAVALRTPGDGMVVTWAEYAGRVRRVAAGLAALGVRPGDAVAIMLTNRPEFHFVDAGAMHLGAVPFSLYNTSSVDQLDYVVRNSGCRVVVTEAQFLDTVLAVQANGAGLDTVAVVDTPAGGLPANVMTFDELEQGGDAAFDFEAAWRAVKPGDVLTLIYTSGTTGPPKCVQLSHDAIINQWRSLHAIFDIRPGGRILSWLPSAHIADRLLGQYQQIMFGHTVTCLPNPRDLAAVLPEVRPTFWVAVPRIWEKFKAAVEAGFSAESDPDRRALVAQALETGLRKVKTEQAGEPVDADLAADYAVADTAVFAPIRERLGIDQAEIHIVGASPIPVEVLEFFHAIGVPVCEVWGMSELAIATANPPGRAKLGTVGPPLPGIALQLADDGEALLRGPQTMSGYKDDPERTAETIDADGWLHTGDVGQVDGEGYLRIVDRKKELIINSTGKNMSPANIEARLKTSSPLIGQAVCIGDARPYNVALLVLDPDGAAAHARACGLGDANVAKLADDPGVRAALDEAIETANSHLSRAEHIRRFVVLGDEWLPGGDELTPTSKLKRKPIAEKYAAQIEALYAAPAG
jgi:long-subunit acyl-CoA synthetase (AMP-forming)